MHTPSIAMRPIPADPAGRVRRQSRSAPPPDDLSPDEIRRERRAIVALLVVIALATALVQATSERARATRLPAPRASIALPAAPASAAPAAPAR